MSKHNRRWRKRRSPWGFVRGFLDPSSKRPRARGRVEPSPQPIDLDNIKPHPEDELFSEIDSLRVHDGEFVDVED